MKTTSTLTLALLMTGSLGMLTMAGAQEPDAQAPATQSQEQERPQATIRQVKGIVQYRTAEDQPWQKVEEGQTLDVGVEFRTGPRSAVTFFLPPDQVVTLDRLGTLKLLDAANRDNATVATTELGMKYGRTRYQVEGAQDVEHHATIRSPSATLAIRGTQDVTFTDQRPGRASASSRGTRVYFRSTGSPTQVVFGSNKSGQQTLKDGDSSPGQSSLNDRVVDAGPRDSRSETEFQLLNNFEVYNGTQLSSQGIGAVRVQAPVPTSQPSGGCGCDH